LHASSTISLQAGIQTFLEASRICQALFLRADRAPGREV
jgi:hypothetical protein